MMKTDGKENILRDVLNEIFCDDGVDDDEN